MTATEPDFDERATHLAALAYRVGFRILGNREDARDVTQEALARAYARWARVGPYDEAWITRVTTNLALDLTRARRRTGPTGRAGAGDGRSGGDEASELARHADGARAPGGTGPDPATVVAQRRELVAVLGQLSRRQREVVALRYLADLSEVDVAAALGCSVGTVKQHASRGLAALRAALTPVSGPPGPAGPAGPDGAHRPAAAGDQPISGSAPGCGSDPPSLPATAAPLTPIQAEGAP